jgi:hypothetical protein
MFPFMDPFWYRQLIALAKSVTEKTPERGNDWPEYFDNTDGIGHVKRKLFYKDRRSGILLPYKGRSKPVPVEEKIGLEAHITAVSFGTTNRSRKFWSQLIASSELPKEVIDLYRKGFDGEDWIEKTAERLALHQRFWKVPYHYLGLLNGDILFNNDITRYTFHGSGGNSRLVGISAEGNFPGLEKNRKKKHNDWDEHTIETNRAAIRLGTLKSREEGAPIEFLYAHRQYSKGRIGDPGEGWWKEVGIPMCEKLHLERLPHEKYGSGYEICREWDPGGRVNYWGK